jgi:hypothetical protein
MQPVLLGLHEPVLCYVRKKEKKKRKRGKKERRKKTNNNKIYTMYPLRTHYYAILA